VHTVVPMASPFTDGTLQDSISRQPAKASVSISREKAKEVAQAIKHLESKIQEAEWLIKNIQKKPTKAQGQAKPSQKPDKLMSPKHLKVSSFLKAPPPRSASPGPPPPGLEAPPEHARAGPMTKEQARQLAEEIKRLEKKADLAEQVLRWCCGQSKFSHHPPSWALADGDDVVPVSGRGIDVDASLRIVVSGLVKGKAALEDDLRCFFHDVGCKVADVRLVLDTKREGKNRGFSFVDFEDHESLDLALKLHNKEAEGLAEKDGKLCIEKARGPLTEIHEQTANVTG